MLYRHCESIQHFEKESYTNESKLKKKEETISELQEKLKQQYVLIRETNKFKVLFSIF